MTFKQFEVVSLVEDLRYACEVARVSGITLAQAQLWVKRLYKRR